jgi:hypothetical protein
MLNVTSFERSRKPAASVLPLLVTTTARVGM